MSGEEPMLSATRTAGLLWRSGQLIAPLLAITVFSLMTATFAVPGYPAGVADLVENARPAIAFVVAKGDRTVYGTAFVVDPAGLLVTALHVVEDASDVSVQLPGGEPQPAQVLKIDQTNDLAILRIGQTGLQALTLADPTDLKLGDEIVAAGYPLAPNLGNSDLTVTRGIVSALHTEHGFIQVDASFNPGVSGGPVLNASGAVAGMADASLPWAQNVNFAVPVGPVKALLGQVDPSAAASPLPLPLTTVTPLPLTFQSGGIGIGPVRFAQAASCVEPPQNATVLSTWQGTLNTANALHVVTWLSAGGGGAINAANTFGYIDSAKPNTPVGRQQFESRPMKVCVNYGAVNNGVLPLGLAFQVSYTLSYRVLPAAP